MQCIILCGGLGSRLNNKYSKIPKCLIKFDKKNYLDLLIDSLKKNSINNFVFLVNHKAELVEKFLKKRKDIEYKILKDKEYTGTGGAIINHLDFLENEFLVIMGDIYCDFNFKKFISFSKKKSADITLACHANSHPFDSDTVEYKSNCSIKKIILKNKNVLKENNALSGIFYFKKKIMKNFKLKKKQIDLVKDIILNTKSKKFAYKNLDYVKDFGTPSRIQQVRKEIKKIKNLKKKIAVFLDRDGVINKEVGPVTKIKNFEIIDGVGKAIKKLNKNFIPCFMVSNQAGVAKRKIKIKDLNLIHSHLDKYLSKYGAYIDDYIICPNSKNKKIDIKNYSFFCNKPKPDTQMIDILAKRHSINLKKSYLIGDSDLDILCGEKRKMKTILIDSPRKKKFTLKIKPNIKAKSLYQAINKITKNEKIFIS